MNNPLVSIVIPCYNYGKYITECIVSCLKQNYKNIEIFVIDDCSTDKSAKRIKAFKDVNYLKTPVNSGYSVAKNIGIAKSKGELIVTLDADDMLTPDSVLDRVKSFAAAPPNILLVHGSAYILRSNAGFRVALSVAHRMQVKPGKPIHAQGVMVRRKLHKKYGLYDETLRSRSDTEMWHRLLKVAKIPIVRCPSIVAFYRKHPSSMLKMRKRNRAYNRVVTNRLAVLMRERLANGITRANTKFLE